MGDNNFLEIFQNIVGMFQGEQSLLVVLLFFTGLIVIYSIFVFYFYRFLAKKNIIKLNLNQYNQAQHPFFSKFLAIILYVFEYVLIIPIATIFWFVVLSIFLLIISKSTDVASVILISAALISSIRVTSYISEDLSRDLAKMLPLTLLALALTDSSFFSIKVVMERFAEIPSMFQYVPYYLLFIVGLEFIMRLFDMVRKVFTIEKTELQKEVEEDEKIESNQ